MPVAGRSLRPSWASLARWFLRSAILAAQRNQTPAPGHGQPLARPKVAAGFQPAGPEARPVTCPRAALRGTDRRLGERPRAAAQRRPRSPGGATVWPFGCTSAAPATAQGCPASNLDRLPARKAGHL